MVKVESLQYDLGYQRLFYISEKESVPSSVIAHVYTSAEGRKDVNFHNLEHEVWALDFTFKFSGKYIFIIFEDGLKTLILIVIIE